MFLPAPMIAPLCPLGEPRVDLLFFPADKSVSDGVLWAHIFGCHSNVYATFIDKPGRIYQVANVFRREGKAWIVLMDGTTYMAADQNSKPVMVEPSFGDRGYGPIINLPRPKMMLPKAILSLPRPMPFPSRL